MNVSKEFTASVVTTAVESGQSGIGYWARVRAYDWEGDDRTEAVISDWKIAGREHMMVLDHDTIVTGLKRVTDPDADVGVHQSYRFDILGAVTFDDAALIDAELADMIVQTAVLGKVIYG